MNPYRRAVVAGLLAVPAAAVAGPPPWTFEAYSAAMKASGRRQVVTAEPWRAAVARKPRMLSTIQTMLAHHFGKADPEVMRAFTEVPREYFHYRYDKRRTSPTSPTRSSRRRGESAWARRCRIIARRPT